MLTQEVILLHSSTVQKQVEAEQALIGAVLLKNEVMDDLTDLEDRDFYLEKHRIIWQALRYQYRENRPMDFVTVASVIQTYDRLEEVGGVTYLSQLVSSVPTASNAREYARIIVSTALRRRGNEIGAKIISLADEDFSSDEDYLSEVERQTLLIRPQKSTTMRPVSDMEDEYFTYLETQDDKVMTGFKKFDEWMGGVGRGWLYILAGRPSVGKTAKVLQMMHGIASNGVGNILMYSQEMKANQLLSRMLSPICEVNYTRIRKKELEEHEKTKLRKAFEKLKQLPIFIEDAKNVTIDEVRATGRQIKRKHGRLGAIVVDYLQIMNIPTVRGETRSQSVGRVTRTAKQIALELDCPFIMLSQLNRDGADEPKLEHLRDSGEIEQDADVVELIWRKDSEPTNGVLVESIIAKGRDVGVAKFEYNFQGWIQRYSEV